MPCWDRLYWPLGVGIAVAGAMLSASALGLAWNETPSVPVGLYRVTPPDRPIRPGDLVTFCPPGEKMPFVVPGNCPNGSARLIKEVAAVAGDIVTVTKEAVEINGEPLPFSASQMRSEAFPGLVPHAFGTWELRDGEVWVYGYGNPARSFDSRYYGPVRLADVAIAAAVWTR